MPRHLTAFETFLEKPSEARIAVPLRASLGTRLVLIFQVHMRMLKSRKMGGSRGRFRYEGSKE
jgi:hypothetical protein